jgi:hypothetical protein
MKRTITLSRVESPSSRLADGRYDNKKPRTSLESASEGCGFLDSSLLHFEKNEEIRFHESVMTQRNGSMESGIGQRQNRRRISIAAPCEENEETFSNCASESSSFFQLPLEDENLKLTPSEVGVQDESLEEAFIKTELPSTPRNTLYQEVEMISSRNAMLDLNSCIQPMKQSRSLNAPVSLGSCTDEETVSLRITPEECKGEKVTNSNVSDFIAASKAPPSSVRFLLFFAIVLAGVLLFLSIQSNPSVVLVAPNSMYLPGAGFSGFWFTLGRLKSIPDPTGMVYYCFSAGCLAAVSALSNLTREEVSTTAFDIQSQWRSGAIRRHDVVSVFLDSLLYPQKQANMLANATEVETNMRPPLEDLFLLSRLQIITTVKRGWFGLDTVIRSPNNVAELREMLLQTTWMQVSRFFDCYPSLSRKTRTHFLSLFHLVLLQLVMTSGIRTTWTEVLQCSTTLVAPIVPGFHFDSVYF